jgi:hypothetical protein
MSFKPTEVQNIQREKGMKIDPLLLPGKVSGISKNRCPIYSGITVRNQQETVSALRKNHCPESAGISVRFTQESLSGLGKNMHFQRFEKTKC